MLPEAPAIVKCGHCSICYWLEDAIDVGSLSTIDYDSLFDGTPRTTAMVDPSWVAAKYIAEPTLDERFSVIQQLSKSRDEKTVRIIAWRRANDPFRGRTKNFIDKVEPPADPDRVTENLEALLPLLIGTEDAEQLLRAEVLRQLNRFEAALVVLGSIESGACAPIVRQISSFCKARDAQVRELEHGR